MQFIRYSWLGIMAAAAILAAGCSNDYKGTILAPMMFSDVAADPDGIYLEPSDTPDQAIPIRTDGIAIRQTLHVSSDVDYFRFLAAGKATYLITGTMEGGGEVEITVTDENGVSQPIFVVGPGGAGTTVRSWTPAESGYFFVRVSAAPGASSTVGIYSLSIGVGADAYEPDNSISEAHPILANGAWQQRTLPSMLDTDYIRFSTWAGFAYQFVYEGSAADAITFNIVDGSGTILSPPSSAASVAYTAPGDAIYYVIVAPQNTSALGTYRVSGLSIDPAEPDSTLALAKVVPTNGETKRYSFSSVSDQDYIQFAAIAGTRYTIRTDSLASGVDTQIELNSSFGTALVSDDNGGGGLASRLSWLAPLSATYYVRVRSGSAGLAGQYVISVNAE
jgi:hypothetical protein